MDKNKLLRILLWLEILFLAAFVILIVTNIYVDGNAAVITLDAFRKIIMLLNGIFLFATAIARTVVKYKANLIKYNAAVATICVIAALFVFFVSYFFLVIWPS